MKKAYIQNPESVHMQLSYSIKFGVQSCDMFWNRYYLQVLLGEGSFSPSSAAAASRSRSSRLNSLGSVNKAYLFRELQLVYIRKRAYFNTGTALLFSEFKFSEQKQ